MSAWSNAASEIYDYLTILYTRIGKPFCAACGGTISAQDPQAIIDSVMALPAGSKLQVLAPIVRDRKGEYRKELTEMRGEGFVRARIDGMMVDLTEEITLKKHQRHTIEIVIDRLIIKHGIEKKIRSAIDTALRYADTVGYHGDQPVNVFPFRDYVIQSFQSNKRFDQFTLEQLAGDLLPQPTVEQRIGSGYNRLGMMSAEGGVQEKEYLAKSCSRRSRPCRCRPPRLRRP